MPDLDRVNRFIAMVEANDHVEAIREFYTADATMQENQSEPRVGRENLIANESKYVSQAKSLKSECIRPFFINGNHVVIKWRFHFEWKDGKITDIEEIAHQTWHKGKILKEQFFYDPKQLVPK